MQFGFNVYSGLLLPFFLQGVVFTILLWVRGWRHGQASDGWLGLFLLLNTLSLSQWMLGFAGWYDSHDAYSTFMFYFPFHHWLALGPTFYFYFRSLTNQEFRFRRAEALHFLPEALYLGVRLVAFLHDVVWQHGWLGQPFPEHFGTKGPWADVMSSLGSFSTVLNYGSVLTYTVLVLRAYRRYRRYLDDNFSDTELIRFGWLRNLLYAVLLGLMVALAFDVVDAQVVSLSFVELWYSYLSTGLLVYYLSIAGLLANYRLALPRLQFQPAPAAEPGSERLTSSEPVAASTPAVSAALPADLEPWRTRLARHMDEAQPYLEPELTLAELAQSLGTNTSVLSRVINAGFGQNFNDFVNTYRVAEVERRLRDARYRNYTLVAIALESGFNSKSTFNRVFKKLKGATPSEVAARPNLSIGTS